MGWERRRKRRGWGERDEELRERRSRKQKKMRERVGGRKGDYVGGGKGDTLKYTFCCLLLEKIQLLMPTSNSLMQKYIHFIQSTFTSVDTQLFSSKGTT